MGAGIEKGKLFSSFGKNYIAQSSSYYLAVIAEYISAEIFNKLVIGGLSIFNYFMRRCV